MQNKIILSIFSLLMVTAILFGCAADPVTTTGDNGGDTTPAPPSIYGKWQRDNGQWITSDITLTFKANNKMDYYEERPNVTSTSDYAKIIGQDCDITIEDGNIFFPSNEYPVTVYNGKGEVYMKTNYRSYGFGITFKDNDTIYIKDYYSGFGGGSNNYTYRRVK